jgi:hypothetical protein
MLKFLCLISSFRLNAMPELKVENERLQLMVDEMRSRGAGDAPTSQAPQSGSMYATTSLNPLTHAPAPNQEMREPSAPHHPSSALISGVFNGGARTSTDTSECGQGNVYNSISAHSDDHHDEGSKKKKVNLHPIFQNLSNRTLLAEKNPKC